jgi:uncharacterized membrane protein YhhN
MKKTYWLIAFFIVLAADLLGLQFRHELHQYIFKPLIVPAVIGYFLSGITGISSPLRKWILFALFFSWVGDILLMFDENSELFFLLGLGSFLVAHIFYILFFHQIRVREIIKSNLWLLAIVVVYYTSLIILLSPYLGDKKLPVRIYGVVISFMILLAMHMVFIKNKTSGKWMMSGAILFAISDTILAVNKFYQSFEIAGILVMLTYGLAQLFIAEGASRYIRSSN